MRIRRGCPVPCHGVGSHAALGLFRFQARCPTSFARDLQEADVQSQGAKSHKHKEVQVRYSHTAFLSSFGGIPAHPAVEASKGLCAEVVLDLLTGQCLTGVEKQIAQIIVASVGSDHGAGWFLNVGDHGSYCIREFKCEVSI